MADVRVILQPDLQANHPPQILWAAALIQAALESRRRGQGPQAIGLVLDTMSGDQRFALGLAQAIFLAEQIYVRAPGEEPFLRTNLLAVAGSPQRRDLTERRLYAWLRGQPMPELPNGMQPELHEQAVIGEVMRREALWRQQVAATIEQIGVGGDEVARLDEILAAVRGQAPPPAGPALKFMASAVGKTPDQ